MTPKAVLKAILAAIVVAAVALYAGDFAWFEYRMQNAKPNDPLETMTFYYATDIKGGKVEVFDDQPQTAICVHSIFPHGGYKPCWRFGPSGIVRISLMMPRRQPGGARHPVAVVRYVPDFLPSSGVRLISSFCFPSGLSTRILRSVATTKQPAQSPTFSF